MLANRSLSCVALVVLSLSLTTCTMSRRLTRPGDATKLDAEAKHLKVHLRNGDVIVLDNWKFDPATNRISGTGQRFDEDRKAVASGPMNVALAEVALFETNNVAPHPPVIAAMTVVTLASSAVTALCVTNPKSCFGSCPTFYVEGAGGKDVSAEAFSSSVAPALEADDVDALHRSRATGRTLRLRVTNEAIETHVIRRADLLVGKRPPGGRVFQGSDGQFWGASALVAPDRCRAPEGDCRKSVAEIDELERASPSDPGDLAARETIEVDFPPQTGASNSGGEARLGLVIEARQTFITTFLLYQALAYMGGRVGDYLADLERGDARFKTEGQRLFGLLGDIEVQAPDGKGGWQRLGGFSETGPIARDQQVVPLPAGFKGGRLRLQLTRGHWRIGRLALATLTGTVTPQRVRPAALATKAGDATAAAAWLAKTAATLVTNPGDEHELRFDLPANAEDVDLFLDSRGYYIEWMREPWLAEESRVRLAMLFRWPERSLRELAPAYKKLEPEFETLFWGSRYTRPVP